MRVPAWCVAALLTGGASLAQQGPDPHSGAPNPGGMPGSSGASNGAYPRGNTEASASQPRSVFVSGRVLLSGGGFPPERVAIQRLCGTTITQEGFTDSKGRFNVQLGGNPLMPEASLDPSRSGGFGGSGGRDTGMRDCELRAALAGFRSESLPLSDRHFMDSPDVGTIFLHRLAGVQGLTVSATTALAPKEARKLYEKGRDAIHRNLPDEAQKDFQQAVRLHPKFAAAWFELGSVYERRNHLAEAREAYRKSKAADASYLNPIERLYRLDLKESKWQDAADASDRVQRLNPYDFPSAYYVNAVANLQLHKLDAAEKSARESAALTGPHTEPAANYLLGYILSQKGEYDMAAEALRAFLKAAPLGRDRSAAEKLLSEVEKLAFSESASRTEQP